MWVPAGAFRAVPQIDTDGAVPQIDTDKNREMVTAIRQWRERLFCRRNFFYSSVTNVAGAVEKMASLCDCLASSPRCG